MEFTSDSRTNTDSKPVPEGCIESNTMPHRVDTTVRHEDRPFRTGHTVWLYDFGSQNDMVAPPAFILPITGDIPAKTTKETTSAKDYKKKKKAIWEEMPI